MINNGENQFSTQYIFLSTHYFDQMGMHFIQSTTQSIEVDQLQHKAAKDQADVILPNLCSHQNQ